MSHAPTCARNTDSGGDRGGSLRAAAEFPVASKSRKVNGYVKAWHRYRKLSHLAAEAMHDVKRREGTLTGGQLAEARRLIGA